MKALLQDPRALPMAILMVCLGALGTAYASEVWGGLKPCVLCFYQRYAYGVAAVFGLIGLAPGLSAGLRRLPSLLAGLTFLTGAGIAAFHVGVERHWWRGTAECHAPAFDPTLTLEQLKAQLLDTPFVACDQVPWSLFGLSMAGYNALASLGLGLTCLWAVRRMMRGLVPTITKG